MSADRWSSQAVVLKVRSVEAAALYRRSHSDAVAKPKLSAAFSEVPIRRSRKAGGELTPFSLDLQWTVLLQMGLPRVRLTHCVISFMIFMEPRLLLLPSRRSAIAKHRRP